jgi:hypothetical protein
MFLSYHDLYSYEMLSPCKTIVLRKQQLWQVRTRGESFIYQEGIENKEISLFAMA